MLGGMITPRLGDVVIKPERIFFRVPVFQQCGDHESAQGHHGGHGRTRDGAEESAGQDTGHTEAARQPADHRIGHLDQFFDNGSGGHDVAAQNEKEHHDQGEIVHAAKDGLKQQEQGDVGKKEKSEDGGKKKAHENGNVGGHAAQQNQQDDHVAQLHERILLVFPFRSAQALFDFRFG
jgi:hypothetical protein